MTVYGRIYDNLSPVRADCLKTRIHSESYTRPTTLGLLLPLYAVLSAAIEVKESINFFMLLLL